MRHADYEKTCAQRVKAINHGHLIFGENRRRMVMPIPEQSAAMFTMPLPFGYRQLAQWADG
ncbi:MAG: hypothetical protein AB8B63_09195 [Granulosicoccus sp.]